MYLLGGFTCSTFNISLLVLLHYTSACKLCCRCTALSPVPPPWLASNDAAGGMDAVLLTLLVAVDMAPCIAAVAAAVAAAAAIDARAPFCTRLGPAVPDDPAAPSMKLLALLILRTSTATHKQHQTCHTVPCFCSRQKALQHVLLTCMCECTCLLIHQAAD